MAMTITGPMFAVLGAFFFAVHLVIIKKTTVNSEPLEAAIGVTTINALVFLPLIVFYLSEFTFPLEALLIFLASGISANFLGRICLYEGTKRIGASKTIPLTRGNVLVASFLGILLLNEVMTFGHLFGTLLLVGGVMILSYEVKSGDSEFDLNISGDLLYPIGAMAFLGTAAFFDRLGLLQGVPIPVGLSVKFLGAVTGLVLYSTFKGKAPFKQFKSSGKGSLVLAGITNSISLALLYSALSISDVVDVMPFWGISPLFGVILSYIFLKDMEKITKLVIIGAVLVMTGAILIRSFM